jgi:hypothetical protein
MTHSFSIITIKIQTNLLINNNTMFKNHTVLQMRQYTLLIYKQFSDCIVPLKFAFPKIYFAIQTNILSQFNIV